MLINRFEYIRLFLFSLLVPFLVLFCYKASSAQLNEHCTVSVLNRTAQVKPDGSWVIPNVPSNMGTVRVRATCVENGVTKSGQSDWVSIPPNGTIKVGDIPLDVISQVPSAVSISSISAPDLILNPIGATSQLLVIASYPDNSVKDITRGSTGTVYRTTNQNIATVSENGLVRSIGTGKVIISASNEMVLSSLLFTVINTTGNNDIDNDGIPDDWELANGLNPNDRIDALEDADNDGLTNKQEYDNGTTLRTADSDGDGLKDGDEVKGIKVGALTVYPSPLLADTDGDGVRDGLEVQTGSNPTNSGSYNLAQAISRLEVTPSNFVLTFNTIMTEASRQLTVTGVLTDGTRLDLTSGSRGTNYNSSDLAIANFGATDGLVYAGSNGVALITVSNSGFNVVSRATVRTLAPTALSYLDIPSPGYANNVDVSGNYAYVAGGSGGLYVANISNPSAPVITGSVDTPGNANDVRVIGNFAYVADGGSGLQIVDVSTPAVPVIKGAIDTPGDAWDVKVDGNYAYVADGANGLQIINISNPALPAIAGSLDTPGTAKGVDVSGNVAVVADSSSGVRVIDISDPVHPVSLGSVNTGGDAVDLVISGNTAFVVQYTSGLCSVDITNPSAPAVIGNETVGGYLFDIASWGNFAFSADVLRVNAVPIHDITTPNNPLFRAVLDFSGYRDDNGTGIAVTPNYLYLTAARDILENGTNGWFDGYTRLYIGQYAEIVDSGTTPPVVNITSPANNAEVMEGATLPVTVTATDDVLTASVNLLVDGNIVSTDNAAPFQFSYQVPAGINSLAIGATGIDIANNIGTAQNVFLSVIPDPPPTVSITSPANGSNVTEGTTITITADAADNTGIANVEFLVNGKAASSDTSTPYQVLYQVPVDISGITISARATDLVGHSRNSANVILNVMPSPPPAVNITRPTNGATVFENSTIVIAANATDDTAVESVKFLVNGTEISTDNSAPYQTNYTVPANVTTLTIGATAADNNGKTGAAISVNVIVMPDPGTTVIGRVLDNSNQPVEGATVTTIGGHSSITLADGSFSILGVPTAHGDIEVAAAANINGIDIKGNSAVVSPVPNSFTDVGDIVLRAGGHVLILSNRSYDNTFIKDKLAAIMADFTFDTFDANSTPTLEFLSQFDAVLLFENGLFVNSTNIGNMLYDYIQAGGNVVFGVFYWQDRSDNVRYMSTGWGNLETIDPFTTDGKGDPDAYSAGTLDQESIVLHPLTEGLLNIEVQSYRGAVAAKEGTTVVARWQDGVPLIGYSTLAGGQRLVAVSAFPTNEVYESSSGDFYHMWQNSIQWAVSSSSRVKQTTIIGLIVDNNSIPVAGATVTIGGMTQTSGADGRFSMNMWVIGDNIVDAYAIIDGVLFTGYSPVITPVPNGITDAGTIIINPVVISQVINENYTAGFNATNWFFGGSAVRDSNNENLVIAPVTGGAGRAFYLTPFNSDSFHAEFDYDVSGGNGADGLTFAWVQDYNYQESGGGSLNFDGASGFAVEFDTYPWNSGDPGARHIGVLKDYVSNHLTTFNTETRGTHHVSIDFVYGTIHVFFDGAEVINYTIPDYTPFNAYFGFTAATGGSNDNHIIDNFILNVGGILN